jgi:primosomal protein N'
MVQLTVTAEEEQTLFRETKHLSDSILERLKGDVGKLPFVVFGPFEANVYKLNEKYRMRMVIKCRLNKVTRALFHDILCEFSAVKGATLAIDLNPLTV